MRGVQVKLIDFGFLLEVDLLKAENFGPADVLDAVYIAPEMREIKQGRLGLMQLLEAGRVTSLGDLLKANDIWMLGQILYYLLCRPKEVDSSKFFAETYVTRTDGRLRVVLQLSRRFIGWRTWVCRAT